jgi:hypothetical protein
LKQIGFANKGFKYKISYSDNILRVRKDLKAAFEKQLQELKKQNKKVTYDQNTEHKRTLPNTKRKLNERQILSKADE